jgi:hypothetical protein
VVQQQLWKGIKFNEVNISVLSFKMSGSVSPGISRRNPQDEYELVQRIGKNSTVWIVQSMFHQTHQHIKLYFSLLGSGTYGDVYKVQYKFLSSIFSFYILFFCFDSPYPLSDFLASVFTSLLQLHVIDLSFS